jgi:glycosyltransferase involved in cell wall biosynthesis
LARIAIVHDIAGVGALQAGLLRGAGHEVDQIALPALGASWQWPLKAFAVPVRLLAYAPTVARLRRSRYDVIHIHWLSHGIVGVLAQRPFFAQAHGSDLHLNLQNPIYRWVTRSVLRHAKRVFYVTPNLKSYLSGFEEKLVYLPNPVDVEALGDGGSPPAEIKKVLVFTRLDPVKGVGRIFPAVEQLSRIAEVTALDWGPLAKSYRGMYGHWVRFIKPVPHGAVGGLLRQFDLVIGQMRQGVLGLMEVEALAAGRPLIAPVDPALYEADPPPVIPASSAEQIVAEVESLRHAPHQLASLSRLGREWAIRNHSLARHLEVLQAAYFGTAGC